MIKTTKIAGYTVELDTDVDGDGGSTTQCFISYGKYCASLEAADDMGLLTDSNECEYPIRNTDLVAIKLWAYANGY